MAPISQKDRIRKATQGAHRQSQQARSRARYLAALAAECAQESAERAPAAPLWAAARLLQSPRNRIIAGLAAVVIVALVGGAFYVLGAGGGSHRALTTATLAPSAGGKVYTIDGSSSKATFTIDEVLFGKPNTVVGTSTGVSGQIVVNQQDPSKSQVGQIRIDLSQFSTDNDLRTRTLQGRIFETSDSSNQFATFTPKSITGLPASIKVGQQVSFKVTGDLTIHQTTRSETFDVQATMQDDATLKGTAQTTVKYKDFNLNIPRVPSVASTGDTVKLALDFTAKA